MSPGGENEQGENLIVGSPVICCSDGDGGGDGDDGNGRGLVLPRNHYGGKDKHVGQSDMKKGNEEQIESRHRERDADEPSSVNETSTNNNNVTLKAK